jgi:NAD(P)-dependent dehydrogenase (short-subunit alcohol dehydrogenase family)
VGDINVEGAEITAKRVIDAGGEAIAVAFDLEEEGSVSALMQATVDAYGRIDLLHANGADLAATVYDTDAVSVDIELFDHVIRVDLRGYLFCARHAIPRLLEQGGGAIVMTSSGAAYQALPNMPAYCAAKAGVGALVRHIAARWGKEGIRCNGILPGGLIQSESMLRNTRPEYTERAEARAFLSRYLGDPEDMANAVAFLLSDDASWMTGQVIALGGGGFVRG